MTARVPPTAPRLAMVRQGYAQMRRLHEAIGITQTDEEGMGLPCVAFTNLGAIMREGAEDRQGEDRDNALAIAEALDGLAILAGSMTWAEVRS